MAKAATGTEPPIPRGAIAKIEKAIGSSLQGWDDCPPKYVSPSPGEGVEGAFFDVEAVAKVIRQLRDMPHTEGRRWAGTPFEPAPWQVVWILAPVFGWKRPSDEDPQLLVRIVNEVWDEIPRKNGKTSLSARLGLILLAGDGELGAQVYAAAGSKEQARFAFDPAKAVAERAPKLKGKLQVLTNVIRAPQVGGLFRVLSKASELAHGANVHGGLIDEIHVHKDRGLIDAIESGTGAREQPLILYTTTANDGDDNTIYGELHLRAVRLATGSNVDPTTYVVIWAADKTDDPFAEETIRKSNPNYPESPSRGYIARKILKARTTPSYLPTFLRLTHNIRQAEEGKRVDWQWMDSAGMVVETKLKGQKCWGGLVTRTAQDLTAIAWTFRSPDKPDDWWTLWRHFMPEAAFGSLLERSNGEAESWKSSKLIWFTEGNVIDLDAHLAQIRADAKTFDVQELGYDPNGAIGIISKLVEDDAFTVVPIYANTPGSALVDLEGLVRGKRYAHSMNPVMAWQVNNLVLRESAGGVTKIDPKLSTDVVPGAVAAEMALRRALLAREQPSSEMILTY